MRVNSPNMRAGASLFLLMILTACGGGGGGSTPEEEQPPNAGVTPPVTNPDTGLVNPDTPEPGEVPTLVPGTRISLVAPERIVDAKLSPDGTEVVILSTLIAFGQPSVVNVDVYNSTTGELLRSMSDASVDALNVLDVYWAGDRISVLLFGGGATIWDAASGVFLSNVSPTNNDTCEVLATGEAFNRTTNKLYIASASTQSIICEYDFNASTVTARPVELEAPSTQIESVAVNADGSNLAVSYRNSEANVTGTQLYDTVAFNPVGEFQSKNLGGIVALGNGYQLYDTGDIVLQPSSTIVDGGSFDISASTQAGILVQLFNSNTRLVAIPELTTIGEITKDNGKMRSFSTDGTVAAFVIDGGLEVYSLSSRGTVSAEEPPIVFPKMLNGTLVVDGVSQTITGTCNALVEPDVGPNIVDISATTSAGSLLTVRAQNLLGFITYALRDGVEFTDSEQRYSHSTNAAQNFSLERPTISTDGTSITGSTFLYQFADDFFGLVVDTADPTGFATRTLTLDATCI